MWPGFLVHHQRRFTQAARVRCVFGFPGFKGFESDLIGACPFHAGLHLILIKAYSRYEPGFHLRVSLDTKGTICALEGLDLEASVAGIV